MSRSGVKLHGKGRVTTGANAKVEGNVFTYCGVGGSTGLVKIMEPLSPLLNYFEIEILACGEESAIGVGAGHSAYPQRAMPGWERNSIGYHADDGKLYHERGFGRQFGPRCTTGDRMGCGLQFSGDGDVSSVNVFFTKNGCQVGNTERMQRPLYGFYPLIGLHSCGEKVRYLGHWRRLPETLQEPMEVDNSPSEYWLRSNGIWFTHDKLTLEYAGNRVAGQDVGMAQANFPISLRNHYFELKILEEGNEGAIAIGLGRISYPLHRHPGWNSGSVGYHADDGQLFKGFGIGKEFGPRCSAGDRMGCGVKFSLDDEEEWETKSSESGSDYNEKDYSESDDDDEDDDEDDDDSDDSDFFKMHRSRKHMSRSTSHPGASSKKQWVVYFTKNGEVVGETRCVVPRGGFYPVVAMLSKGEKIVVNFEPLSG